MSPERNSCGRLRATRCHQREDSHQGAATTSLHRHVGRVSLSCVASAAELFAICNPYAESPDSDGRMRLALVVP